MYHLYLGQDKNKELCFNIETSAPLTDDELNILRQLLAEGFIAKTVSDASRLPAAEKIVELGPRLNFATAFSTNAVGICHACGLNKVTRVEASRRYALGASEDTDKFSRENHDRMTECVYPETLESFETGQKPEPVFVVPLIEQGIEAIKEINKKMGLGMDEWDENFYFNLFTQDIKRNPTNVECFQLGQANSEHSRHWFFKGIIMLDGEAQKENLMQIVKSTLDANQNNSLIAFKDNSSAIRGYEITTILPVTPGQAAAFKKVKKTYHPIFTAETHNFPSGVAPFPGAETGGGGRIRDVEATGRGALVVAGTAGYCVGNLQIPNYDLPWEDKNFTYPENLASPLKIEIDASNGASDYGNKFGEPLIQGFTRSFGLSLPNGERREWIKPIMFSGGVGQMDDDHLKKEAPAKGMVIIQIGGPQYRIGMGGGAASSMIQGANKAELDFNAVQRGDAEMEQKMNRVIRACVEMGEANPILSIHDQGAGGPCNVLTELVEPLGGRIEIRNITIGDNTLSVLEIWGAEAQERNALLLNPDKLEIFKNICAREGSTCEVLGEITGDGKIVVHDANDDSTPVNLELEKILGKMPQKTFSDTRESLNSKPLELPTGLTMKEALEKVLRLVAVGSKRFLVHKVDRSVTGLIARQQCAGPLQLTVSDVSVVAQSHFGLTGTAIAIGEQPIKMLLSSGAGARLSVGEALTNIVWARLSALEDIKCSGNWMWATKLPGEAAKLYDAAVAMRDIMIELGIAIDGGKDSLSMATKVGDTIVKSPGELTISAYATMPDITKVITPDIKKVGESELWLIDLGQGKTRMGGSALAQTFKQIGDVSPDLEDATVLKRSFNAIQKMIDEEIILAGHDRSDGGLITTILEMAFSGNCGLEINAELKNTASIDFYFNEELGMVVEVEETNRDKFLEIIKENNLADITLNLGETTVEKKIKITNGEENILDEDMRDLRALWEATSFELEKLQRNPENVVEEKKNCYDRTGPKYHLSFTPEATAPAILENNNKPKIAIIREEGSNGDREMTSAFYLAGFEPWDVTMSDILKKKVDLADFRGVAFIGGFSYADAFSSAKGWAGTIRFNPEVKAMFDKFYHRADTFSLGVCNGCQLSALLGWVPWRDISDVEQPRLIHNKSGKFESRWVTVKINESPAIMFKDMADSVLGVWVAHGEGRFHFPNEKILEEVKEKKLISVSFTDDNGATTESYPFNPNGSPLGITGLCSPDGRHLAMMPHPERVFLKWQHPYLPAEWKNLAASPWLKMFQNAYEWCKNN